MNAAIAKSKAADVFDMLAQAAANRDQPSAFTLARMKRDAKSALNSDVASAYTALGIIAALEWDEAAVHQYFKNLLQLNIVPEADVRTNYGSTLQLIARPDLALEQMCQASALEPTNLSRIEDAIKAAMLACQFETAQTLCAKMALCGKSSVNIFQLADICKVLQSNNITQAHTEQCSAIAFSFLRERKIRAPAFNARADLEDNIGFFKIPLNLPFEEIYELDDQLARYLIQEVPDFSPSAFWLGLDYWRKSANQYEY